MNVNIFKLALQPWKYFGDLFEPAGISPISQEFDRKFRDFLAINIGFSVAGLINVS